MPLPDRFPVVRYQLDFVAERAVHLPEYAGSALRGVFGHALREVACVTREPECRACACYQTCAYPEIFETPPPPQARRAYGDIPHPYVVEPPPWGRQVYPADAPLRVGLVLMGPVLRRLPLLLLAWRHALGRGLGPAEGTAALQRVWVEGESEPVLADPRGRLRDHAAHVVLPAEDAAPSQVTLDFVTPLRLKRDGHPLGVDRLTPQDLLMGLVRRVAEVSELHLNRPTGWDFAAMKRAAGQVQGDTQLAWRDWTRYSSRQQRAMTLGGAIGRWTLRGDLRPFWPLLHLGQWLHVGGKTTFGLGRYHIASTS